MDLDRIAELLQPFVKARGLPEPGSLSPAQLSSISTYIDLLQRWNARINLTAVRDPDAIVTRHFGESLFVAAYLFPVRRHSAFSTQAGAPHALDFGSGAGFPGLPLKIYAPQVRLTLIESNRRKAAFLSEVIRALGLSGVSLFGGRADSRSGAPAGIEPPDLVMMRAVERFETAILAAASLVRYGAAALGAGKLALLIGQDQAQRASQLLQDFTWEVPVEVPQSRERVLLVGRCTTRYESR